MLIEEENTTPVKKRNKKDKATIVHDFAVECPPTCAMLGFGEKETEALFSVGTVYISAQAIEVLNGQLATIRREKRGA